MIHAIQSPTPIHSEGSSQQDRFQYALNPEYVQVEGRSIEDLIGEAQRLAKEIQFFDAEDQPVSNWEALLVDNAEEYLKKSDTGKEIQRKKWANQLASYIENPANFHHDAEKLAQLSRPHVVLFLTFLKLLNHIKSQINGLTKDHLDFYFLQRLGMTHKEAVPDIVNVVVELANDVKQFEVSKGTILFAGNDAEGNELHYQTDQDTVISEANIAQIKTVFIEKNTISIQDAHLNNLNEPDKGFGKMMELALGSPRPGDPLPPFPTGVLSLLQLNDQFKQNDAEAKLYIERELGFSSKDNFKDFAFVLETHLRDKDSQVTVSPQAWEEVYGILDQAFKNRIKQARKVVLREQRESDPVNGLDNMLQFVYGSPEAGDELPPYRGNIASVSAIYQDLLATTEGGNSESEKAHQEASAYVQEELFLTEKEFVTLAKAVENPNTSLQTWEDIYASLELANRKVRGETLPSPAREELFNIYAEPDARAKAFSLYGEKEESLRFRTFGGQAGADQQLSPAAIGFAISSPMLSLEEGKRKIKTLVAFEPGSVEKDRVANLLNGNPNDFPPFRIFLSSEKKWVEVANPTLSFGDHIAGGKGAEITATKNQNRVTQTAGEPFTDADIGKYLIWSDGAILEITHIQSSQSVTVQSVGMVERNGQTTLLKYDRADIYLCAMKVEIELQAEDLPVATPNPDASQEFLPPAFPTLVFALNHALKEQQGKQSYLSHYQRLMDLKIAKIHLAVEVEGIRSLILMNEQSPIDPKKPFEPFGNAPEIGNSFYLANLEISHKRLDDLKLELQWMNKPDDFASYYENYWKVAANNPSLSPSAFGIQQDSDFKAQVFLFDHRAELDLGQTALFTQDGQIKIESIPQKISANSPSYQYTSNTDYQPDEGLIDWTRYFRLELEQQDFQHSAYNGIIRKQAMSDNADVRNLTIHSPYTPKLKSIKIGYKAHTEILMGENAGSNLGADHPQLFHLHPFGYAPLQAGISTHLLPEYHQEGSLYLGFDRLLTPQNLSILFQLSEGSADPDVQKPQLQWSYLKENQWNPLDASAVLSDTTHGLLNTGIIQLSIPADATDQDSLMPGNLHWLKLSCDEHTAGVSDTIQVVTQAVSATFCSNQVAASHFVNLLPAESITETVEFIPEIRKITQPYTSSKGKPAEQDATFNTRISERLRHKNRAITMWDYEHMVLDRFPEVFKVKCLPVMNGQGQADLGRVNVLVIPDIKGKLPFNPFEPKVPADTVFQIQTFLDYHAPAFADVVVSNPTYLQVKARCVVKFKAGYNEGFYKAKLIEELKKFLAPWAYGEGETITIGGTIYSSVILNFIAERPYIDYVANMKLFQSEDGKRFTDARSLNNGKNQVTASRPDTVLVSAQTHEIDVVDENGYDEESFEGINYMKIELDFKVGENVLS